MFPMLGLRRFSGPLFVAIVAVLVCSIACSRPLSPSSDASPSAAEHQAPFHDDGQDNPLPESADSDPIHAFSHNRPPFHDSQTLPAGTLLTVQLKNPVYASNSISSTSFEAVVVEPVIVQGNTIIPAGATAEGRVEAARSSKVKPSRGYVRLALESVQVAGLDVPIQTASLFAPQSSASDQSATSIRLEKGRRLTFRFAEPISPYNRTAENAR
jgi:hypothetical protein